VEEHFYLLWPGLLVLVGVRRSVAVGVIAALLIAAWRVISIHNGLVPPEVVGPPDWRTDTQLDALIWGGITGLLLSRHKVRSWLLRWTPPSTAGLMVLLFCGLIVVDWLMPHPQHPQRFVLPLVVSAMLAMTIVRPAQSLSQMLESAPLRWVGRLSYSIYLWQQLFTPGAYIASSSPWLRMLQVKPFNLLALGLTAVASYYLLEKPMMALGHRLAKPVTPGRGDLKN
jgi:peptidoglycan/LPS O-acetylase OafA/YrhL